jgi:hypothetical protein
VSASPFRLPISRLKIKQVFGHDIVSNMLQDNVYGYHGHLSGKPVPAWQFGHC